MAVKTYYAGSGKDLAFGALFDGVAQTAATRTDGWTVGKLATGNSALYWAGLKQGTGVFSLESGDPKPQLSATLANGLAFKAPAPLTGTFAATAWTLTFAVRAATASSQAGRMRLRVFRSTDPDSAFETQVTSAVQVGTATAGLTTTADATTTVTWNPGAFALTAEYLFFELAWEVTTAGGSNNSDVLFRTGSAGPAGTRIVTPDLSVVSPATKRVRPQLTSPVVLRAANR